MAAPKQQRSGHRRLRRAVVDLSQCAIEDIEAIWNALTESERAQLGPLLAETPYMSGSNLSALEIEGTSGAQTITNDEDCSYTALRLARLAAALPTELGSRFLSCIDHKTRDAVMEALPADQRPLLASVDRSYDMTEATCAALREAAFAAIKKMDDIPQAQSPTPGTFGQRIRHWLERFA
jgi:hypothetical protein